MQKKTQQDIFNFDKVIHKLESGEILLINLPFKLRNNKEIVIVACKTDGLQLKAASERLKNDPDVVSIAIKNDGAAIDFASPDRQNDLSLLLKAIKEVEQVIQIDDNEIVGTIVNNKYNFSTIISKWKNFEYLIKDWWVSKEFVLALIEIFDNASITEHDPTDGALRSREIMIECAKRDGIFAVKNAADDLKNDRELVKEAVKNSGYAFAYLSDEFKKDLEIVMLAIEKAPMVMQFVPIELLNDLNFLRKAYEHRKESIFFIPKHFFENVFSK